MKVWASLPTQTFSHTVMKVDERNIDSTKGTRYTRYIGQSESDCSQMQKLFHHQPVEGQGELDPNITLDAWILLTTS